MRIATYTQKQADAILCAVLKQQVVWTTTASISTPTHQVMMCDYQHISGYAVDWMISVHDQHGRMIMRFNVKN